MLNRCPLAFEMCVCTVPIIPFVSSLSVLNVVRHPHAPRLYLFVNLAHHGIKRILPPTPLHGLFPHNSKGPSGVCSSNDVRVIERGDMEPFEGAQWPCGGIVASVSKLVGVSALELTLSRMGRACRRKSEMIRPAGSAMRNTGRIWAEYILSEDNEDTTII
jgi:hypothetical protein